MTLTDTLRSATGTAVPRAARAAGAVLALAVAALHVVDQGGLTAQKSPAYVGVGYWVLEVVAVLTAVILLSRGAARRAGWLLATGVAAAPLVGYALSRGPGLPDYTDDRGNWTEPLGLLALGVEIVLLVLAGWAVNQGTRPRG